MTTKVSRRDAIKAVGALAGTAAVSRYLTGCGGAGGGEIDTLVFLMMENRSYDTFLGSRAFDGLPGDGLAAGMFNLDRLGAQVPIWPAPDDFVSQCIVDPPHTWDWARVQWNNGANDGFVLAYQQRYDSDTLTEPMQYMVRERIPVTHALADAYTSCDRWFASILGPTFPNRMYWHAATSNGARSNDDVYAGAFDGVVSIHHRLDAAGIDWAYYYGNTPTVAVIDDLDLTGRIRRFMWEFIDDAAAGRLPPVVYVDPSFAWNDDHPPHHPLLGQQLLAATYQALATSPHWPRCLLVVAYDENGGFFDHVPPPQAPDARAAEGFGQLGFRVPAMVIGPYARPGHVSSVQYDHTSPLKHLENRYGLEPLGLRDAAANDLSDCIDAARLSAGDASAPITLPPVEIDESSLPSFCIAEGDIMRTHDMLEWTARDPRARPWYRGPKQVRDDLYDIAAYLDKHNLGRIRRR